MFLKFHTFLTDSFLMTSGGLVSHLTTPLQLGVVRAEMTETSTRETLPHIYLHDAEYQHTFTHTCTYTKNCFASLWLIVVLHFTKMNNPLAL